jgi:hypothetical protein
MTVLNPGDKFIIKDRLFRLNLSKEDYDKLKTQKKIHPYHIDYREFTDKDGNPKKIARIVYE